MSIISISKRIPDPRVTGRSIHKMEHIIYITIAAVLGGAQSWYEIAEFGEAKIDFFKARLDGLESIPSHDTFNRFFSLFDPKSFEQIFREWVAEVLGDVKGVIAIDGKLMRRPSKCDAAHPTGVEDFRMWIVSAWSADNGFSLGQERVSEKSNEITAIPKLLDALDLSDTIVTIDAMGCQSAITKKIMERKGNYIIALKENQRKSLEFVKEEISDSLSRENEWMSTRHYSVSEGHGRREERNCVAVSYGKVTERLFDKKFAGLQSYVGVVSKRTIVSTGETSEETRYYITSLGNENPEVIADAIRKHWSIENNLHWQLDFTFNEDESRKVKNAARNFSALTKMALSILKQDNTVKGSLKLKRLRAGWDEMYLDRLLLTCEV